MTPFRLVAAVAAALWLAAAPAPPAAAQDASPGALKAAEELIDLIVATGFQDAMIQQGWPPLEAHLRKAAPTISDRQLGALRDAFSEAVAEEMKFSMQGVPALYTRYFTAGELRDVLAFYQTPTGKKTLVALPKLSGETARMISERMPEMQARMKARFEKALAAEGLSPSTAPD